ncbi:hypothetical protein [Luteolibacter soli]|uniref:Uncharacterized protein n=1 Tax=Luteolibacter soli TaxID=3135280 RepID=A0ABU9AYX7_9BACT
MKNTATIGIAALLAGAAGGYFAGKAGSPDATATTAAESAMRDTKTSLRPGAASAGESKKGVRSVKEALSEPGQMARMQSLMDLYAGMNADQLQEAAGKLEELPMAQRIMASMLLFSRWGEVDPQGALAHAATLGPGGFFARPTILQSWASSDPANAAKYFSEHPGDFANMGFGGPGGGGEGGAGTIAAEWAKLDPTAAIAWANSLNGNNQTNALRSIITELAGTDPTKAAQIVTTLPADEQGRAYGDIAEKIASKDFAAAETFIAGLPADVRDRALSNALNALARTDPQAAAAKLSGMAEGNDRDRAISGIADGWARQDPAAAAAWLSQQTSDNMDNAVRSVVSSWAGRDSAAALSWIQSQPQGDLRDEAVGTYIWTSRNSDPQSTMQLAESITDENTRNRSVFMATRRWMQQDRDAATAYIQQSTTLSDDAKQNLLDAGNNGGRGGWGGGGPGGGGGNRGRRGGN